MSKFLTEKFLEGQDPLPLDLFSMENIDWYNEHIERCFTGYEFRGTRITGDHYWYLNFFPIVALKLDRFGNPTDKPDYFFPYPSKEDDYVFKQMEEAHQAKMNTLLITGRGFGKCLAKGTKVRMADGSLKEAQNIVIGDMVMGTNSQPRKVVRTYSGMDDMYEIVQNKGISYTVNSQHLVSLKRNSSSICKSKKVKGREQISYPRYKEYGSIANIEAKDLAGKSNRFFDSFSGYREGYDLPEKEVLLDPYYLGIWLGDGSSHSTNVTTADKEIVQFLEDLSENENMLFSRMKTNNGKAYTYSLIGKEGESFRRWKKNKIKDSLKYYNLLKNKHIPDAYLNNSREVRLKLLAGLLDSDGHNQKGCYSIIQKNKKLAYGILELCRSLGFQCSIKKQEKYCVYKGEKRKGIYHLVCLNGYTDCIPLKVERKKFKRNPNKDLNVTKIKEVNCKGKGEFFGFTIDGDDHLFLLEDGTVTHNSFMMISVPAKYYYLQKYSDNIVSSSQDDHVAKSFGMLRLSIDELERRHPTLRMKRLFDNDDLIESGEEVVLKGDKQKVGNRSQIRKIVFDRKAGKTRGSRPTTHLYEEIGAWSGAAKLRDCYNASVGSYKRGSIWTCRVMFIGTGGEMKSGGSEDAKEMFWNPESYNIYPIKKYHERKTGIFMPAYSKYSGFWEKTGYSDEAGARAHLEQERENKKGDKKTLESFKQEYPFDPDEAFMVSGSNNFDQEKIIQKILYVNHKVEHQKGDMGFLHWKYTNGKITGTEWEKHDDGNIWMLEQPEKNSKGELYNNLYISGYDGIDMGQEDTASGKGSSGCLSVKKRMLSSNRLNNAYVCFLVERPEDITIFYEDCRKISWHFNCLINIEDTKRGIVGHFGREKELSRFMKRPKMTLSDPENGKSTLIGVTSAPRNYEYGELFLIKFVKHHIEDMFYLLALEQLRDFRMESRTKFDIVVSMMMAEIADEEMIQEQVQVFTDSEFSIPFESSIGWYFDENGDPHYGKTPTAYDELFPEPTDNGEFSYGDMINNSN